MAKEKNILYNTVKLTVFGFRNIEKDIQVGQLTDAVKKARNADDGYIEAIMFNVVYTEDVKFNWTDDTPEEYRNLETFWNMVIGGQDISTCYAYYIQNVPNPITRQWSDALTSAHTPWKPKIEENAKLRGEDADPNS